MANDEEKNTSEAKPSTEVVTEREYFFPIPGVTILAPSKEEAEAKLQATLITKK